MKTKILSGLICCLGIYSATAQTITAPLGTPLTITNAVDIAVPGGTVNVPNDGSYNFGATKVLSIKGTNNLFVGPNTGTVNTGTNNVFVGGSAGQANTSGYSNLFFGGYAGNLNTTGYSNLFFGISAGEQNTTGYGNMFVGSGAGVGSTTGLNNLFLGTTAGRLNGSGNGNIFIGSSCGFNSANVDGNTFMGTSAAYNNTGGTSNSGIGQNAGYSNTTGSQNTFIGHSAGFTLPSGTLNTFIGASSDIGAGAPVGITNATAIGGNAKVTTPNTVVLGNAATVVIGATGFTGTAVKLEIGGTAAAKSGIKNASLLGTGVTSGVRTPAQGYLTVDNTGEIVWAASGATARLGNPDGITSAEGTATFSDNNWSLANGYLRNTSKRGVVIGEGITSMPEGYSFYVADGILTEKVKVAIKGTDEWADYVFGKNYNRMSLTDVAKYIEKNNHLPNVPSAAEMVQNGNDLHKTDVKLLEKIEELTLYMIEMKKENEQLKKDVDSLKKRRK